MGNTNRLIILTAPSGAGKTSITRFLLEKYDRLSFSVSATTRKPRTGEKDGIDYYFISVEDFQNKINSQAFVEWEMVYEGKYYGTLKSSLQQIWDAGKVPVLDIDVQGAVHVQQQFPGTSLTIFIEPPSLEVLKMRLETRQSETPQSLETRLNKASYELSFKHQFDKVIVNDVLEKACRETAAQIREFLGGEL